MLRVDAHHHLWKYNSSEYGWLEGDLALLRRDFLPAEIFAAMGLAGVGGSVAVQARQSLEETDWLLGLAAEHPLLLGVVGWLPLLDAGLPALLDRYGHEAKLKGLRHVVQAEPAGFMEDSAFNNGIRALRDRALVYDLLIRDDQLEEATQLVDRHPKQMFVLDHLAKPRIAAGELQPWAGRIRELARRENVVCKLSGMVTEADPKHWSAAQLEPYFQTVLESFTPARLLVGTDWPVLCAGCSYAVWWDVVAGWMSALRPDEQAAMMGGTAIRTYGLSTAAALDTAAGRDASAGSSASESREPVGIGARA